jgi:hypothetical protein
MCITVRVPCNTWRGITISTLDGTNGSQRLTMSSPSEATVATFKYRLTSLTSVALRDGRVPCNKCAHVRRKLLHSAWRDFHAVLDVNGSVHVPFMMSSTDKFLTTEPIHWEIKEQIWQVGSLQSGALRLSWSDGRMDAPATWQTDSWYLLTLDR